MKGEFDMFAKKNVAPVAIMLATVVLASACSGENGGKRGGSDSDSARPEAQTPVKREPAEVVFYSNNNDPTESFDYRFGNTLRQKFPEYTIKYIQSQGITLEQMIATNTTFDIFFQSIGNYENFMMPAALEYDMTDLIREHKVDLNKFEPTIIEAVKQASGGKMYGLPIFTSNLVLYYNKTLFDKFGVPYPKSNATWEETIATAKKMARSEGGVSYFGLTHSQKHMFRLNPLSIPNADLAANAPTINKDERWKTFYQTLFMDPFQDPVVTDYMKTSGKIPDIYDFTDKQRVAMFPYLSSLIYAWEQQLKAFNWDIVALPSFTNLPNTGSPSYPTYFGITKTSKSKAAAMEVLKYMVSDEFQMELARKGIMPVLKSDDVLKTFGTESPFKDKNLKAVFEKKFAPNAPKALYDAKLIDLYTTYGLKLQKGELDLNTALRQADEDAAKLIAAELKK
ncbi:extracellular solute-binding protein [Paenibacillus hemerocallicola]|uniref:Extracellular solute-binding protein n=2 Tax=Paenibacillus hemerocallicola TaxID=1172614 RepID=A0A5C4T559_9BACL|nr:extracellular solute-binding protein [Paenibacillus hemerocallicola]